MDAEIVTVLEKFINQCKANPSILFDSSLSFFRDYIENVGGKLPPSAYKSGEHKADDDGWFHLPPWKERMLAASDQGMLVFLQNLDPEYTSAEVEDIIWNAFREKCNAKVVQWNACSNPHIGQALLIFKSSEAAERVVRKLNDGCLVVSDQRPLVGHPVNVPKNLEKQSKFAGHLVIDKFKLRLQRDDALSTSHCAQPNTIEHELAMEWCLLRSRCDIWWKKLHKKHGEELERLMGRLQSN